MSATKLLSLNDIFKDNFFRIPDFQRGYSWEDSQLNDFWEDIKNLKEDKIHYMGLLTVELINQDTAQRSESWEDDLWMFKDHKAYYLIDGQQRLTTTIILINELLSTFSDDEKINNKEKYYWQSQFLFKKYEDAYNSYIFGYEKDNPSDEFFKTKILNQISSKADKVADETLYTKNLESAKTFFKGKIEKLSQEEITSLFNKVISNLKFNFYVVDNELDVYVTFETMNNRGKPLSNLELLKNRLIYLTTLLSEDENKVRKLRKDINEVWKTIYECIGRNKYKNLSDDDFLKDHWIIYFRYDRKESESYAKFLLNKEFTSKNVLSGKVNFSEINNYINSLQESVKYWFYLNNPEKSKYSDEIKEWIDKLRRIGFKVFTPLLIVILMKYEESKILDWLKLSERFIFLLFFISRRRSTTANSKIYRYANELYKNNQNFDNVYKEINNLIEYEISDEEDSWYGWLDLDAFQNYIKDNKNEGFYSWNGLKYFLYEYELYLKNEAKGEEKITWLEIEKRSLDQTIEHIYPQNADNPYWKTNIDFPLGASSIEKKALLHSLGNLVLLSRSKNSKLQNYAFDRKKRYYSNGSYSEIEVAKYEDWTAESIQERGRKMIEFMEEHWSIKFKEWKIDLDTLLGIDFLKTNKK